MEDNHAVHPIGHNVGKDIADIEVKIAVGAEIGYEPGDKGAVEGVDAAYNEKEKKFLGEKVMLCLFYDIHNASIISKISYFYCIQSSYDLQKICL